MLKLDGSEEPITTPILFKNARLYRLLVLNLMRSEAKTAMAGAIRYGWRCSNAAAEFKSGKVRGISMGDFRKLSDTVFASPQIGIGDLEVAKAAGIAMIVNNRPDGEDSAAPQGEDIATAAEAAGLAYIAIPIGHSGFSEPQIDQMMRVMDQANGPVLAYCRSGTRSTFLWALARAKAGEDPDTITTAAMAAGYDVSPIQPMLDMFSAQ